MRVLVTGGAGYIGSHTCIELLQEGHEVLVLDALLNSQEEALRRVQTIAGRSLKFAQVDLLDETRLTEVFQNNLIEAVIHFAGLKSVGESVQIPLRYYHNNLTGTLNLCESMRKAGVKNLVFSSSATVYDSASTGAKTEGTPLAATNPYGRSKLFMEEILRDLSRSDPAWNLLLLRYFNPAGAHPSGKIGESPNGKPNNLVPYVAQVATGQLPHLNIYGRDYETQDGTGVRDYIHVTELASAHVLALNRLALNKGLETYNLGTGRGYSVLEVLRSFEQACGKPLPYQFVARRPGDVAACYADPSKANRELGWMARKDIDEMCADAWRWQSANPRGYE